MSLITLPSGRSAVRAVVTSTLVTSLPLATAATQPRSPITLNEAVSLAQQQGTLTQVARQSLNAARWNSLAFAASLRPQVALTGSALNLDRSINPVTLPTGEIQYISQANNQSSVDLSVSQRLRKTDGRIYVSSQLSRIDLFGNRNTQYWQTTPLIVGFSQAVFRPRTLAWEEENQRISLSMAEHRYLEAREDAALLAVSSFFDLYAAEVAVRNATVDAVVNDTIYRVNKAKFESGSIGEQELLQSELALFRKRAAADAARLNRTRAEAALRRVLNLPAKEPISLTPPPLLSITTIDEEMAATAALSHTSLGDQIELDALQARRHLSDERLNAGFYANISATVGFNQSAGGLADAYKSPLGKQRLGISVGMPLVQWGAGTARIEAAQAELTRSELNASSRRREVEEEARLAALQFGQSRTGLTLAAKADSIATRRFTIVQAQYSRGSITLTDLLNAQTDRDNARLSYVEAERTYWVSYYQLRRATLYDFVANRRL
jgi:outer membrane protein TolC